MNMVTYSSYSLCLSLLLAISIFIHPSNATTNSTFQPSDLVKEVCNQTSNFTFCVDSLYSDPRTPHADRYVLAYVSFGSAYRNADATRHYIAMLLSNNVSEPQKRFLQKCSSDYTKAVSKLQEAFGDLDSETFYSLAKLAGIAASSANDCQAAFNGTTSPLTTMNKNLKGLCEICVVVSKLFTQT